ncbi:MAG: UDP-N-acetylglucosamine 1-carboxyvinyltransferase [Pseudomonadota bacterium]|nr:UDP-N-acetylglucosamine 1-carboxyvinyltransferase [Pseudomonadota bacterium]
MSKSYTVVGQQRLAGRITPAGNKNEILPCLAATLLTDADVIFTRVPKIGDVLVLCDILRHLGAQISWRDDETLVCNSASVHSYEPSSDLCAKVRASILLLAPLLARFGKVNLPLPGGDVIGARRIDSHWDGITALGGRLTLEHGIKGEINHIRGCEIYLDEPSVTATENIILLAVLGKGTTVIRHCACEPHVVGLCNLLVAMGAQIAGIGSNCLTIQGVDRLHGAEHELSPDFMEVGSFLCLGAIGGGDLTIERVNIADLRFVIKTLTKLGIHTECDEKQQSLRIQSSALAIKNDLGNRIPLIYSGAWPAFPTDLMSVAIVAATQAQGTIVFFEKMFEGRMFFIDGLLAMGANIVLCDPHRVVISGASHLTAAHLTSPDVRAGMALLMAALIANGESRIDNVAQIERGYGNLIAKLQGLGANITEHN